MNKIEEQRLQMLKNYEVIANEEKVKRQAGHQIYLDEMNRLDKIIKEKEKNAKLEIERIRKENAEIIRKSKENSRKQIEEFSKELEQKYQN